jgi:hypothetical protein
VLISTRDSIDRAYFLVDFTEDHLLHRQNTTHDSLTGFWKQLYATPAHLLTVEEEDFSMAVDPLIHLHIGKQAGSSTPLVQNSRGLRIRGLIDQKVYFHTMILETQRSFPSFINEQIETYKAIPGQGFYRDFQSRIWDSWRGYDYLNAQAYVGFRLTKSIDFQLGHGQNFIGYGNRSLLLSDFGNNYFYTKLSANFWKFQYQSIFAELASYSGKQQIGNELVPKKYMAAHYLDFAISDDLSIGLYEAVIFGRADKFELQYLNPVILYRSVEQFLDSPDNALIGLNAKWNIANSCQAYGQLMIDELKFNELLSGNGWWGNKLAYQLGLKYPSAFGVDQWDTQIEWNSARPFTYTHRVTDSETGLIPSYTHYSQPLAHPLGANFNELIWSNHYQINDRWTLSSDLYMMKYTEKTSTNDGAEIYTSYDSRLSDYGFFTTRDNPVVQWMMDLSCSYSVFSNYYLDFRYVHRSKTTSLQVRDNLSYWMLGIRANLWQEPLAF